MASAYFRDKVNNKWPAANLDILHHIACAILQLVGPWLIGADWNCTPEELEATGWLALVDGVIFAPAAPTCNGKKYDFFVVARAFLHAVFGAFKIGDALCAPHAPTRLLIRAKPRAVQVQVIKSPCRLDACLPHGPAPLPDSTAQMDSLSMCNMPTEELFTATVKRIEAELNAITGIAADTANKHPSRLE